MKNYLIKLLATGLGVGFGPVAPGTYGTIVAIPFFWLLCGWLSFWPYLAFVVGFIVFACWISEMAGKIFKNENDCQLIVIDEIAGYFVTMIGLGRSWQMMFAGFVVFRILDSWKPWPIRWFDENIHGGTGVVLDDIVAGVIGCGLIHLALFFMPRL